MTEHNIHMAGQLLNMAMLNDYTKCRSVVEVRVSSRPVSPKLAQQAVLAKPPYFNAQRLSKVSEWLLETKKRISLCLCVFVREMVLSVLRRDVQNGESPLGGS